MERQVNRECRNGDRNIADGHSYILIRDIRIVLYMPMTHVTYGQHARCCIQSCHCFPNNGRPQLIIMRLLQYGIWCPNVIPMIISFATKTTAELGISKELKVLARYWEINVTTKVYRSDKIRVKDYAADSFEKFPIF